jgi:hypothetical protein
MEEVARDILDVEMDQTSEQSFNVTWLKINMAADRDTVSN